MLKLLHSEGAWSCYIASDNAALELPAPTQLLEQINAFTRVLKDDRRSLVKRGHLAGMDVIAKQPRDKSEKDRQGIKRTICNKMSDKNI